MQILKIEDVEKYNMKELKNLHQLVAAWKSDNWITEDEKNNLVKSLENLNVQHHSKIDFEYNLVQFFSIDNKDEFIPQTIDRHRIGGHFAGVKFNSDITLLVESLEMGVIVLIDPNTVNQKNIKDLLLDVNRLIKGINDPEAAQKEMQFDKLEKELPLNTQNPKKIKI